MLYGQKLSLLCGFVLPFLLWGLMASSTLLPYKVTLEGLLSWDSKLTVSYSQYCNLESPKAVSLLKGLHVSHPVSLHPEMCPSVLLTIYDLFWLILQDAARDLLLCIVLSSLQLGLYCFTCSSELFGLFKWVLSTQEIWNGIA